MNEQHVLKIADELGLNVGQVRAAAGLLEEEATVPFIARYRKEATGSLDEVQITAIRDRLVQLDELDKRREAILKSLEERELLSDDLRQNVLAAETMAVLEDIYLPFRPKRRTRATIAKEKGLEPLALRLFDQDDMDPVAEALQYVDAEKGVADPEEALAGARDIIAEWVNEDADARAMMREMFFTKGVLSSHVLADKEEDGIKYRDYYDWIEPVAEAPSHRILAIRRGENEGFLTLRVAPDEEEAIRLLEEQFVTGEGPASEQVRAAVHDGYKRLLALSMETEARMESKKRADQEAIKVFAENLRQLLLASPLGSKRVLAIDPGFRTGCKVVCLDEQGELLHTDTIYPSQGERRTREAAERLLEMCERYGIEAVAIGNGTASRETEAFVRQLDLPGKPHLVMVNESGASVYSASDVAREEFPNQDVTVRGSVSIGRRLMDPLAELVKIDAKSIGVGQYQHDVDQAALKQSLDDVVTSCVNLVGVELNTASKQLLSYVSGLGPKLAENIVRHRAENGRFRSRQELLSVPRLGPKAFEQAAGFLRVRDAENPLDASAVHPESYPIVEAMARDLGCDVADLIGNPNLRRRIDLGKYVSETVGLPTLNDILDELAKPGRDPREKFEPVQFAEGVEKISDVEAGMKLPGVVTNITNFGAFVDIGVHQDGLVHISQLSDRFVKDANEVVKVGQQVQVTVLEVDLQRQRISLTMKGQEAPAAAAEQDKAPAAHGKKQAKERGKQQPPKQHSRSRRAPNTAMGRAFMESLE